jgi:hypothetical protein
VGFTQRRGLDPYDKCFEKVTPRKIDTFSHHEETPRRYEPPIAPRAEEEKPACPFKEDGYCREIAERGKPPTLHDVLTKAYSERIKTLLCEPSTSVVIRSEQQFHLRDLARFAQRRHFYEVVRNGTPGDESRFGAKCTEVDEADRFGEYLGFVDLRQHYQKSPLAFGLLVQPSWIREDPNTFVIGGIYGPLFGAHSFRSTVYTMQDPQTIGAVCAQMCAIMALGMLADRGAEVKGSFSLTYLGWKLRHQSGQEEPSPELGERQVEGLTPRQLRDVLRKCGANSKRIQIDCERAGAEDLAIRIIEANIYARFPVILAVDLPEWTGAGSRAHSGADTAKPSQSHAITLVGVRRNAATNEPVGFIVHDPGSRPFLHIRTERCLRSARAYQVRSGQGSDELKPGNAVSMVMAATHSIRRQVDDCIRWLRDFDFSEGQNPYGHSDGNPERFGPYEGRERGTDYRIRLLNRNTVRWFLDPLLAVEDLVGRQKIRAYLSNLWESRFWAVIGFREEGNGSSPTLSVVWLFDARKQYDSAAVAWFWDSQPVAKFWRDKGGDLIVWSR